jgi:prepilin-type N-terminal cleavage/methylation domain-containing protein
MKSLPQHGYTLIELLVTMAVGSVMIGIAAANLRAYNRSSKNAVSMIQGFVKQARAKGIARTAAYRIYADGDGTAIRTSFANSCTSASFTVDTALVLTMPEETKLLTPTWSVCFNSRGLANSNVTIPFKTRDTGTKQVEVLLGGGTREL